MKLVRLALAAAIAASTVSVAHASTGTVTFNGEIVSAACSIAAGPEGDAVIVPMGQIGDGVLAASANTGETAVTPFSIKLESCVLGGKDKATVNFTGAAGGDDDKGFQLAGTATGAHLLLVEADGSLLANGEDSKVTNLVAGENILKFGAKIKGSGVAATPGVFTAPVNFAIKYN